MKNDEGDFEERLDRALRDDSDIVLLPNFARGIVFAVLPLPAERSLFETAAVVAATLLGVGAIVVAGVMSAGALRTVFGTAEASMILPALAVLGIVASAGESLDRRIASNQLERIFRDRPLHRH
jgi:hypothetical protein